MMINGGERTMEDIWERWEPVSEVSQKYYVDTIIDNIEGLKIVLSDSINEESKIVIFFNNSVHAYRSTDESYRQKMLNDIDKKYGTKFYSEWTLFKVTNSEYLKWISNQSFGIAKSENLTHFIIVAIDSIIDIIAAYEPKIEYSK
jgi:hypothetical protein